MTISQTTDPLATYRPLDGPYDELLAPGEGVRQHWSALTAFLGELGTDELTARQREVARLLGEERVTYNITTGGQSRIRPWQVDAVPVVIGPEEWNTIELGLRQRAELLDLVLADIYGPRRLVADGLIPPEVVFAHPGFLRECAGIRLPGPHQLFHAAFDIGRDEEGDRVVLADRTQAPSGAGYALENRIVVARVFPDLYRDLDVQRLAAFFRELRTALRSVAPDGADSPRIVVLTPGPFSETAFEHAFLASYLGFPLVQGADLRVRDGRVWMRTLGRLEPVDVILRRVDATFCDPLELRPESHLGVPGLLEACREGTVSVVNTVGSGVLENPGLLPFLPRLSEVLLDEPLRMPSVTTWWCGDDAGRRIVLDRLAEIIIRPIGRGAGAGLRIGWQLSAQDLDDLRRQIEAEPHAWVGQESVALGAVPTLVDQGLEARRSVVRAFVVPSDDTYTVMPGGLTRVSTDPAASVITNQLGAVSKDTWVLASEPEPMSNFWMMADD
ncbi:MAG: circularly permuted type 2 ATP-grasp protein, partial [Acidimicrobiales bacterium]